MYYGARYYDPALGRFLEADTIVPGAGNPQSLNRYSYTFNNPVKYVDPSGHDVMLVGGFQTNDWEDPVAWKDWVMAYKGWSEQEWNDFYYQWKYVGTDAIKTNLMELTKVHFFNWNACGCAVGGLPASVTASVDWAMGELYNQMQGMQDITLIGHSKGGNLVLNFLQNLGSFSWGGTERPKNAVIIDAPTLSDPVNMLSRGRPTIPIVWGGVNVVNIYNVADPSNQFIYGGVIGAKNYRVFELDMSRPTDVHSMKGNYAGVLDVDLNVQFDHGARGFDMPYAR